MGALAVIPLREHENEPRVFDLDLAERLGFERARDVRQLLVRHRPQLERFGICVTVPQNTGERGRPALGYWLNEKQAYYICTKSDAPNADAVTVLLVETFYAWRHGKLIPAGGQAQMDVRAMQVYHEMHVKPVLDAIMCRLDGIDKGFQPISDYLSSLRRDPSANTKRSALFVLAGKYNRLCPLCRMRVLLQDGQATAILEWDHVNGNHYDASYKNIMPICAPCHRLKHTPGACSGLAVAAAHEQWLVASGSLKNRDAFGGITEQMARVKKVLGKKSGSTLKNLVYKVFSTEVATKSLGDVIE
jgi:hypothetical protein